MNIRFSLLLAAGTMICHGLTASVSGQTISTVSSFDFVDDFLSPSPGSLQTVSNGDTFDVVDSASGGAGTDGVDDFRISWSATGLGDDGNNVTWDAVIDINGTGLRSTINPAFVGSGGVSTNNSGHVANLHKLFNRHTWRGKKFHMARHYREYPSW